MSIVGSDHPLHGRAIFEADHRRSISAAEPLSEHAQALRPDDKARAI